MIIPVNPNDLAQLIADPVQGLPRTPNGNDLIKAFNGMHPNQLNFVITRDDWNKLALNQTIRLEENGHHVNEECQVFAFVFCYGIFGPRTSSIFFFRVRQILKPLNFQGLYYVDSNNMAYANVGLAQENASTNRKNSCLTFINTNQVVLPPTFQEFTDINNLVTNFKKDIKYTKFGNNPPLGDGPFRDSPPIETRIEQGNIFGKNRILDLLNHTYPHVGFVTVNFAYDNVAPTFKNKIEFVFNINYDYVTNGIACPPPSVCH